MRDHFCPASLAFCCSLHVCGTTVKRPHFSVWLLYCSSPVSGGRVHGLKATLRTHLCHIVPGSGSSLKLGFNRGGVGSGFRINTSESLSISNESEPKTSESQIYTGQQRRHASRPSSPMQIISSLCCVVLCQQRYFWCYSLHII